MLCVGLGGSLGELLDEGRNSREFAFWRVGSETPSFRRAFTHTHSAIPFSALTHTWTALSSLSVPRVQNYSAFVTTTTTTIASMAGFGRSNSLSINTGGASGQTTTQPQSSGGLFGSTAQPQQPQSSSLFGAKPAASQPQSGGLFGSTNTAPAPSGGLFGGASSQAKPSLL